MDNLSAMVILAFIVFLSVAYMSKKIAESQIEDEVAAARRKISNERSEFEKEIQDETHRIETARKNLSDEWNKLAKDQKTFHLLLGETAQSRPELSKLIAEAQYYLDMGVARDLLHKKRPAVKAADEVKRIAAEKRGLLQQNKAMQYQLDFYENLFPWLEDFKEVPIEDAINYVVDSDNQEYDAVRHWLSPEEYDKLSNTDKFQLALNRWQNRKKTSWDIGIDFERCIGYQLEQCGYKVKYLGATLGLEDMGRDLIATKDGISLIIQCKRWSKEKTIHEKHICQLYGSVAVLATQNPAEKYKGVFITTTSLSDTAKLFAEYSDIAYVENCDVPDFPMIKCNISKSGEKIYHLPFDQQYDRVEISNKAGAFYAWTTKDAEAKGFRRAYRWHPDS